MGQGIALRILSGLLFAAMVACVKTVADAVPLGQIVFFRSFFALGPLVLFLWLRNEFPSGLRTRRPGGHALRAVIGAASMFTGFAALSRLGVAEATLLGYLAPLFLTVLAVVILGERLTRSRAAGLALGFAGVLALTAPDLWAAADGLDARRVTGIGLAVLAALLTATAMLQIRRLTATEGPGAIAFWFAVVAALAGLATAPLGWVTPEAPVLGLLVLAGLLGGCAHLAMTMSFKLAEASALAPFEYITLIWAVLADLWLFGTPIGPAFVLALPLLLTGAAVTGRGERRRLPVIPPPAGAP
ncbi:EamA family transporter [Rhodobaculum claviforme]|uniref:EamA family transporter n=2 Tax=Rhodobaculum claviforme TaxID=1549854 RepID=A0A934WIS9_9RHOB|nr:DMT family transporter [Rhodobaculum claviforme]MBK5926818.1 EamA family transporter [Rhodobaculum claviforme]